MSTPPPNPSPAEHVPANPEQPYDSPQTSSAYGVPSVPVQATPPPSTPTVPKTRVGGSTRVARVRLVWASVMLMALAAVYFSTAPEAPSEAAVSGWEAQQVMASTRNDLNNESTQGAPQQSVVNGWYANDLLDLQVTQAGSLYEAQLYEAAVSRRTGDLLALLGLAVLGDLVIQAAGRSSRPKGREPVPAPVQ